MPKVIFPSGGGGGGGSSNLIIQEEGTEVQTNVTTINFVGADVQAQAGGAGIAIIYIPTPTFASHYNTQDGTTDGRVNDTNALNIATKFIAAPTSEGTPYNTGGWAGTNRSASNVSFVELDTVSFVTAVNGSTFNVNVVNPDGSSLLSYTTPAINGNGTNSSAGSPARISVEVASYQADSAGKFKALINITVRYGDILSDNGLDGGRFNIIITQTVTDGTGPYVFNMATNGGLSPGEFFYDTNPTNASGTGATIAEKGGSLSVKHLSGIEYYTTGSVFTFELADIDNYNQNTVLTSNSFTIRDNNEYGFSNINQSPIAGGSGNANFTGWTTSYNVQNVSYSNDAVTINRSNFRYFGNVANATARLNHAWGGSTSVNTSNSSILIDTYGTSSTDTSDNFNDEARRLQKDYTSAWVSANTLSTASTATCQIEVVANLNPGDTINLTDETGSSRAFVAGTDFNIGASKEDTATNIASTITASVNFGNAFVSPYPAQANFLTVNQSNPGPDGNRTNAVPTGSLSVSNFTDGSNDALVMLSFIQYASRATFSNGSTLNPNWSTYKPDSGGANPDYSSLGGPASYYRTIVDATGLSRSSIEVTFVGRYNNGNVTNMSQYLQNSALKFFIRKVASSNPSGISGKTIPPMRLHGSTYAAGSFNQGKTIEGSYIRVDNTPGNTIQGTFGIFGCQNGFYLEIQITDQLLKLDSISVTFV